MSIIVPTRNRAPMLARALESVAEAASPADLTEVIVVDNGSTDATAHVCSEIRSRFPAHPWRYVLEPVPGLLAGRHRGAREAQGDLLCFLDDDVLLGPDWTRAMRQAFEDTAVVLAGGPSRPLYEAAPPPWLAHLWRDVDGGRMLDALSLIDLGKTPRWIEPYFVWGLNFAIRKHALYEFGGFHPDAFPDELIRFRGDGEGGLAYKILEKGRRAFYHPQAQVTHVIPASRLSLEALQRRAFAQGISDSYTRIRRAGGVSSEPLPAAGGPTAIRALMASAHAAGVTFHRSAVCRDPALLQWILKPDYLDYRLPEAA